jgi:selenocysteine-specific elongation factor
MPILRAFVAPGRGTVVTGIPVAGRIAEGEAADVLPVGWKTKVKGVQVHHRPATEARAGHRAAFVLADVQADQIQRGMVLATAGTLTPVPRFSGRLRVLRRVGEPLRHGTAVRVHVGADQLLARLHLLEGDVATPGSVTAVELQGERPFLVAPGDRYVLRAENASETYGGGVVVERLEGRLPRRREGIVASILERAEHVHEPRALVAAAIAAAGERGADLAGIASKTCLRLDPVEALVAALQSSGAIVVAGRGRRAFDASAFQRVRKRVLDAIAALHRKDPALPFLPMSSVRAALSRLDGGVLDAALEECVRSGDLKRSPEGGVTWKGHSAQVSGPEAERCAKVLSLLEAGGAQPPDDATLEAEAGLSAALLKKTLLLLEARREAFRAGPIWFHSAWIETAKARLAALAKSKGSFTASDARDALGTTRKYVIPLLETLDEKGFTKRVGDARVLK